MINVLNKVIDNLYQLEGLNNFMPSVIQIVVVLSWIFIIMRSKFSYKSSLSVALFLLFFSIPAYIINLIPVATVLGQYSFLFLSIGTVQIILTKETA